MDRKMLDKLEELFYNFGETSKHIGRVETDGKTENAKKYDKLCKEHQMYTTMEYLTTHKPMPSPVAVSKYNPEQRGLSCVQLHTEESE